MNPYTDDAHLSLYVFEDSWVLGFEPGDATFAFRMDVVPSNTNPKWHPPPSTDAVTSWLGRLVFSDCRDMRFEPSGVPPTYDANRETDFGAIDTFMMDGDGFVLSGDWGDLAVAGGRARVVLDDPSLEA